MRIRRRERRQSDCPGRSSRGRTSSPPDHRHRPKGIHRDSRVVEAAFDLGTTLVDVFASRRSASPTRPAEKASFSAAIDLGKAARRFRRGASSSPIERRPGSLTPPSGRDSRWSSSWPRARSGRTSVFRRVVNGVLKALGPVARLLDWVLDQAGVSRWTPDREAILAIRFVKDRIVPRPSIWAATKGHWFQRFWRALEIIGATILTAIAWAAAAGDAALESLGEATVRLQNSRELLLTSSRMTPSKAFAQLLRGAQARGSSPRRVDRLVGGPVDPGHHRGRRRNCLSLGQTLAGARGRGHGPHPQTRLTNLVQAPAKSAARLRDVLDAAVVQPARDAEEACYPGAQGIGAGPLECSVVCWRSQLARCGPRSRLCSRFSASSGDLDRTRRRRQGPSTQSASIRRCPDIRGLVHLRLERWFRDDAVPVTTMRIIHCPPTPAP